MRKVLFTCVVYTNFYKHHFWKIHELETFGTRKGILIKNWRDVAVPESFQLCFEFFHTFPCIFSREPFLVAVYGWFARQLLFNTLWHCPNMVMVNSIYVARRQQISCDISSFRVSGRKMACRSGLQKVTALQDHQNINNAVLYWTQRRQPSLLLRIVMVSVKAFTAYLSVYIMNWKITVQQNVWYIFG